MKKFLSFLGGVLRISTSPIVQGVLPAPIAGILTLAENTILAVESAMGDGNGVQKGQLVRSLMKIGLAPLVEQMEKTSGAKLVDESLFAKSIDALIEAVVGILNSFHRVEEPK